MKNNFKFLFLIKYSSYIYVIIINLLSFIMCDDLQRIFTNIYQNMKYLPEGEEIRFDRNQICANNPLASDLIKNEYNDTEEKYFCFANKSLYVLINSSYSEILFNLNLTSNCQFEKYYELIIYTSQNNLINFIVSFISNQNQINFYHYIKKIQSKEIIYKSYTKKFEGKQITSLSISCKIVIVNEINEKHLINETNLDGYYNNIRYIKSSIVKNSYFIFICFIEYNDDNDDKNSQNFPIICIFYNYKNKTFSERIDTSYDYEEQYYPLESIQTYYFEENKNIIFFINYYNGAQSKSINEKFKLVKSGECKFSQTKFLYYFLGYNKTNNNYILISNNNDTINCNINKTIIPNITFYDLDSISHITSTTNIINQIETTYIISSTELSSTTIPYFINSSIIVPLSTPLNINSTISSLVTIPFSSFFSTYILSSSSFSNFDSEQLIIKSTLINTISIESTLIGKTTISSSSMKTTSFTDSTNNILLNSTLILPKTSIPIIHDSMTQISIPETTLLLTNFPSFSIYNKSFTFLSDKETTINEENNNIIIYEKIETKKGKIMEELPNIIKNIEIGKIYEKIGEDYSILIYPTNSTYLTSKTHVNFSECETILRNHYKIPDSDIMTFLQIELNNENSKSLINQVEYQVYDGKKTLLNLSLCDNIEIQVVYAIKNNSL